MAYIAPNTWITLCKNVPLDASYDHQITFANVAAQRAYFLSKKFVELSANSYQRAMSNKLRIACTMEQAVQCNYLYFSNDSFENKWFYAFITGWEYINNVTTEITYEIDVFQTFWFDVDIKPSFVEREHSNTDVIGENLVPETLEQGDYIVDGVRVFQPYAIQGVVAINACAIFYCTFEAIRNDQHQITGYQKFDGGVLHNVYTGLCPIPIGSEQGIKDFISDVTSSSFPYADGIIAAYMCPFEPLSYDAVAQSEIEWDYTVPKEYTSLAGYVPKNKKLFTYPYNAMRVFTDSDSEIYKYEYFSDDANCLFKQLGYFLPEPVLSLVPKNYQSATTRNYCLENRMTIREFPQIAVDIDVWKVYFAQHGASLVTSMIGSVAETGAKLLMLSQGGMMTGGAIQVGTSSKGNPIMGQSAPKAGNMAGGIAPDPVSTLQGASSLTGIATSLAQLYEIQKRPPELKGQQTSLSDFSIGVKKFYCEHICIRPEFAAIIDDYFNMFGYATHRVKVPNITGRPYWNYVKTQGIVLDIANAPQPYIQKMIDCFNRGITFWHNPANVGRYDLDNSPVTTP